MAKTIALVALMASGKSLISEALVGSGYTHFSYGAEIAAAIDLQNPGVIHTRNMRSDMAEYLRFTQGNDVLARRLAERIDATRETGQADDVVIDGLRHPDEVIFLRQHFPELILIGIALTNDTNDTIRYERYARRNRELDRPITPLTFRQYDNRDRGVNEPQHGNHVDKCMGMVDILLMNDGTKQDLCAQLLEAIQDNQQSSAQDFAISY